MPGKQSPGLYIGKLEINAGSQGQTVPVDALTIEGPSSPTGIHSAQALEWKFASGGSAQARAYRDTSWGTHLQFLTNAQSKGKDAPQVRLHISENGSIGVGTESPTPLTSLDVVGSVAIRATDIYPENIHDLNLVHLSFLKNTGKLFIGWNRSDEGETDFISNRGICTNGGGFQFWDIGNDADTDPKSILRICPNGDVKISGNLQVAGTITKQGGSFVVDHPLDPENKTLRHNFVESPENLCLYRGEVTLDESGRAVVKMPDYFAALTNEEGATVTLTPIGKKPFPVGYEWSQPATEFTVHGEPGAKVSYLVLADRDDPIMKQIRRPVEERKGVG